MNVFTIVSKLEHLGHDIGAELEQLKAAEKKLEPMLQHVDVKTLEAVATPLIVGASHGKISTAESNLAIEGIFEIIKLLAAIEQKFEAAHITK